MWRSATLACSGRKFAQKTVYMFQRETIAVSHVYGNKIRRFSGILQANRSRPIEHLNGKKRTSFLNYCTCLQRLTSLPVHFGGVTHINAIELLSRRFKFRRRWLWAPPWFRGGGGRGNNIKWSFVALYAVAQKHFSWEGGHGPRCTATWLQQAAVTRCSLPQGPWQSNILERDISANVAILKNKKKIL